MLREQRNIIKDAREFGKVAVLMGGRSAEREVSLKSGGAVLKALCAQGIDAHGVDVNGQVLEILGKENYDRVFIVLHGRGGEDGLIQGALETLGLPYTGSGVLASALGMDKLRTKQLWQGIGLPTPCFRVVDSPIDIDAIIAELGLPLAVKPTREGSSIGISRVTEPSQFQIAWEQAKRWHSPVLVEPWVTGQEYTGAILQNEVFPLIRLETPREFYDFEAKYHANDTHYHCPCGLDDVQEAELRALVAQAFAALDGYGWGRVDFMIDEQQKPWLLEVNTVPGMTDHSLVPMAASVGGLDFQTLVWRILETSTARSIDL
jgi:D-alanine-D-alanine ligase